VISGELITAVSGEGIERQGRSGAGGDDRVVLWCRTGEGRANRRECEQQKSSKCMHFYRPSKKVRATAADADLERALRQGIDAT